MIKDWFLRHLGQFRRDRLAVAAVEFGLLAPLWLTLIEIAIDFGQAFYLKLRVAIALNTAAQYAFLNAQSLGPQFVTSFLANVQTVALTAANLTQTPTVTVLLNNAASAANAANYYCVSGTSPVVYTSTGSSSASCGGSLKSGKFVTITIAGSMPTFLLYDPILGSTINVVDSVIVRFQ